MSTTSTIEPPTTTGAWFRTLGPAGRRAFRGAFGGYALDAYDFQVLPLGLVAIAAYFHLSSGAAGLLSTVTLVASGLGGALAGILADRIGRVRTLMITIGAYALFTVLCGFAPDYPTLLVLAGAARCRVRRRMGESARSWSASSNPNACLDYRGPGGRFIQSSWAVGWATRRARVDVGVRAGAGGDRVADHVLHRCAAALLVFYLRRR